jgi:hypothetical protein
VGSVIFLLIKNVVFNAVSVKINGIMFAMATCETIAIPVRIAAATAGLVSSSGFHPGVVPAARAGSVS